MRVRLMHSVSRQSLSPATSRRQKIVFAAATTFAALILSVVCLLAIDVYAHSRVQNSGGVNIWGYRGPTIGRKRLHEIRVVVLGGSTAFGYGVPSNEAFAFYLEGMLNARGTRPFRVVNLGAPSQGAYGFRFDLADYAYLEYDVAILYEGYNDLS